MTFGPFRFDAVARRLMRGEDEVPLQPRVLGVLECLLVHPGVVVSKAALTEAVWKDAFVTDASIAEAISTLRAALGDDPQRPVYIQTVHRRGYRFIAALEAGNGWTIGPNGRSVGPTRGSAPTPMGVGWDPVRWVPWAITACAVLVAGASVWQVARVASRPQRLPARLAMPLEPGTRLTAGAALAVSPDGQQVVWAAHRGATSVLILRALGEADAAPLAGTEGATAPFFSPDGAWVGFFADGQLKKIAVAGGRAQTLSDARDPAGGTWTTQGTIVFSTQGALARVSDQGGAPVTLARPPRGTPDLAYAWPDVLPEGNAALATVLTTGSPKVVVVELETGDERAVVESAAYGRSTATGHLVFARGSDLFAARLDEPRRQLTGPAVPIVTGVATSPVDASAAVALSTTGTLVYVPGGGGPGGSTMRWLDARGREFDLPVPARSYRAVSLAPDGKHAAVTIGDERAGDTWIGDLQRGTLRRLTFDGGTVDPVYTPDGTRVVYAAGRGGPFNLFWQPVDGGVERRLSASDHHQFPDSWSPDGRTLAYTDVDPQTRADLWLLSVSASAEPRETQPLARTPWDETAAAFSPDGRSVAYQSNESGRWEVLLIDRDAPSRRQAISADGGASAAWAPDGRTIFYRNGDAIMGVGVAPDLTLSRPRPVMTAEDSGPFVVGADGRFLSLKAAAQAPPSRFNVVLEWFAELERIVPAPLPKTIR